MAALLGPKTDADLVKPDKKKKAAKPAAAAPKDGGAAAAAAAKKAETEKEKEEAWRTADPYAFLPKPQQNNMVHTTVHFRWAPFLDGYPVAEQPACCSSAPAAAHAARLHAADEGMFRSP